MKLHLSPNVTRVVNLRSGAIAAASAIAAAASAWEIEHRRVLRADLAESELRVLRLTDLRGEKHCLAAIADGLRREWGVYAFLGFESVEEMAARAGDTTFVVVKREGDELLPRGIVQTLLGNFHGEPQALLEAYPAFADLTSPESWKRSRQRGGDTAVLLQITALGDERGGGIGSLLRNTVLNMLGRKVRYALTTTPVDGVDAGAIDPDDPATYSAAMRFHARGGARPTLVLPGYKTPADADAETGSHGHDVVVMRYERDESGAWPARPEMRLRSMGPLQERLARGVRRRHLRRPHLHRPSLRLRRRNAEAAAPPDAPRQAAS